MILGPILVTDGAGWAPQVGTGGQLAIVEDRVVIGVRGVAASLSSNAIRDVQIDGQSVTTGGGFVGGGFGVQGAAEGMLIASVLNALTTRKRKWVTIQIVADGGWVSLRIDDYDVISVRKTLRALADWAVANKGAAEIATRPKSVPESSSSDDIVNNLERLARLRASGALTEEEFVAAKRRALE